jgi:two-component system sensor histidine kinase/response regulator
MDCQMQKMDGYEATQTIRQRELTLDGIWKAADSRHRHERRPGKVFGGGMNDYLSKPVRTPNLKATLERRQWENNLPAERVALG